MLAAPVHSWVAVMSPIAELVSTSCMVSYIVAVDPPVMNCT